MSWSVLVDCVVPPTPFELAVWQARRLVAEVYGPLLNDPALVLLAVLSLAIGWPTMWWLASWIAGPRWR